MTPEGPKPALSDIQARALLDAPPTYAQGRAGSCHPRRALVLWTASLRIDCSEGERLWTTEEGRPAHAGPRQREQETLPAYSPRHNKVGCAELSGHAEDKDGALYRADGKGGTSGPDRGLSPGGVYTQVVKFYMEQVDIVGENMGPHALRATAATSPLENDVDISQVQAWLGNSDAAKIVRYGVRVLQPSIGGFQVFVCFPVVSRRISTGLPVLVLISGVFLIKSLLTSLTTLHKLPWRKTLIKQRFTEFFGYSTRKIGLQQIDLRKVGVQGVELRKGLSLCDEFRLGRQDAGHSRDQPLKSQTERRTSLALKGRFGGRLEQSHIAS